jgi:hypothetical protein
MRAVRYHVTEPGLLQNVRKQHAEHYQFTVFKQRPQEVDQLIQVVESECWEGGGGREIE